MKPLASVLVLKSKERCQWKSLSEVIPRLISDWKKVLDQSQISYQEIDCDDVAALPSNLHFDTVLIPALTPKISKTIQLLRGILKFDFKIMVYAYGAASRSFLEFYDWQFEQMLEARDQIIVNCEADKILGMESYKFASFKVQPFTFLMDVKSTAFDPQNFFFLYHGRINPQKNILAMIKSYELTLKANPDLSPMYIVGDEDLTFGPIVNIPAAGYRDRLISYVNESGLSNHVFFHSFMEPELLESSFLNKSHAFVSFSQHMDENFGLAAYKSLSRGMPAILSGWGGHFELQKLFAGQVTIVSVENLMTKLALKEEIELSDYTFFDQYIPEILEFKSSDETKIIRHKWGLNMLAINKKREHATPFLNMTSVPFKFYFEVYSGKKF